MTKESWANLALCVILGSLAIVAAANLGAALTPKGLLAFEPKPSAEAAALLPQVVLARYEMGESLDKVVEANFFVQNKSGKDVKNIGVMCDFFDEQGGYVDRERWLLPETVPAGQAVRINQAARRFVNSRTRALNCRIVDFQLVQKPFFALARVAAAGHGETPPGGHGPAPAGAGH